ncbi:cytochrome c oxidase subunit II [Microbulbifer yueqingensis]|uniref:cytochrome-c oxidase n=1 Tax=Microbulbifer yueqingensis TaxID=658219 RepID=A0A1G9BCE8_9GAMM|nr:cytochrome c oxidase subunit II [Microbulbifer yueqingensis]SDK36760.1 cytochrome c oxidase subunit 2 [Microbulbifer yueqingensis]
MSEPDPKPPAIEDPDLGLQLIPDQASEYAAAVDYLYFALLGVSGLLLALLFGLVVVFAVRFWHGVRRERGPGLAESRERRLEIGFVLPLTLSFLGLFYWATELYVDLYTPADPDITIDVVAKQWMWKVQHPDGTREINTLHVPQGEAVALRITSQDVIHSLWLPAFRLKRDAVPGMYTSAQFTPTQTGTFRLFCAEYCGTDHARMRGKVVVLSRADYQQWLAGGAAGASRAQEGGQLFQRLGCSGCHKPGSSELAPALEGLMGSTTELADGSEVVVDEAYIRDSIIEPQKQLVAGYQPIMPSFSGQVSEEEIMQLISYIQSLGNGGKND